MNLDEVLETRKWAIQRAIELHEKSLTQTMDGYGLVQDVQPAKVAVICNTARRFYDFVLGANMDMEEIEGGK